MRFEALSKREPAMLDCNCSICSASGYLHLFIPHDCFTLVFGQNHLVSYRFGSGKADHLFCKICGVKSFYQPKSHPDCWSVHFKCVDDVSALAPSIIPFDGRNWEKAAADKGLG
ncbi:MAG: GFA family protein [Pseudomonadota bacterium]